MRKLLVAIAAYINDLSMSFPNFTKCEFNVKCCVKALDSLIFIVHTAPTKCMEYLGFIHNSENMIISLSDVKKQKIRYLCTKILNEDFLVIWKVASLLGKISSSFSAVQFRHSSI